MTYLPDYVRIKVKNLNQNSRITAAYPSNGRKISNDVQRPYGILDGAVLTVHRTEDDIDEEAEINFRRQAFGLDAPKSELLIKQMMLEVGDKTRELSRSETQKYLRVLGQTKTSAELAQNILQRLMKGAPLPEPGKSPIEIAEFNTALLRINAALDGSDDEFVEWMSPLNSDTPDLEILAKKLQDAGSNAAHLKSLLADFRGLSEDQEDIAKQFATARFDKNSLKRELRKAQNLPILDGRTKAQIKEKIQDEIKELQRQHGSHLHALRNLFEKAGDLASKELAETYDELVHAKTSGFVATIEILLTKHSETKLLDSVIPLFEKTLSHELHLTEEERSVDKEKLHAILSEIQHMHILKTLIERIEGFVTTLGRLYGVATG